MKLLITSADFKSKTVRFNSTPHSLFTFITVDSSTHCLKPGFLPLFKDLAFLGFKPCWAPSPKTTTKNDDVSEAEMDVDMDMDTSPSNMNPKDLAVREQFRLMKLTLLDIILMKSMICYVEDECGHPNSQFPVPWEFEHLSIYIYL